MANKKATIYILNISESMGDQFPIARDTMIDYLEDKLLAAKKTDLASVLLVGTRETNNILAEETPDQYQHISALSPLEMPQLKLLRTLKHTSTTDVTADVLDAVIIANQMIVNVCKKLKYTKSIVVFTNNALPIDWLDLDAVADMLNQADVKLTVVACDHDLHSSGEDSTTIETNTYNWGELAGRTKEGGLISLKIAYDLTQDDFAKEVRPTPSYRGYLYLGDQDNKNFLAINIYMYLRTKESKLPSGSKWSMISEGGTHGVERESKYMVEKSEPGVAVNEDEQVEKESLVKGYRFGKSIVKLTEEELMYRKLKTHKEMTIIGFMPRRKFPRHYLLANANIITAGNYNTEESALALKSLAHAMNDQDSIALVRYVSRDDGQPRLGILQSEYISGQEKGDLGTFLLEFFLVAFVEDLRDFKFKSLKDLKENDPEGQAMMDQLVDSMDLDSVGKDYLTPENNYNPFEWRMNKMIKTRALDPEAPIPDFKGSFQPQFELSPTLKDRVGDLGSQIASHCKVRKVVDKKKESRKKAKYVEDLTTKDTELTSMDDILRNATESSEVPVEAAPLPPVLTKQDDVMFVGEDTPVEDFRAILNRQSTSDPVEFAMKSMAERIIKLLEETFGDSAFDKVIDCLREFRKAGAEEEAASIYNNHIREVKSWCDPTKKGTTKYGLWDRIKRARLGLITNEECEDTDIAHVTKEVGEKFYDDEENANSALDKQSQPQNFTGDNEYDLDDLENDMF